MKIKNYWRSRHACSSAYQHPCGPASHTLNSSRARLAIAASDLNTSWTRIRDTLSSKKILFLSFELFEFRWTSLFCYEMQAVEGEESRYFIFQARCGPKCTCNETGLSVAPNCRISGRSRPQMDPVQLPNPPPPPPGSGATPPPPLLILSKSHAPATIPTWWDLVAI